MFFGYVSVVSDNSKHSLGNGLAPGIELGPLDLKLKRLFPSKNSQRKPTKQTIYLPCGRCHDHGEHIRLNLRGQPSKLGNAESETVP